MLPYFTENFGNPHSRNHAYGWEAEEAVEKARAQVAAIIGADEKEIIFTSGATESNNLAIKGVARFYKGKKNHIITVVTEHKCVLDSCRHLELEGFEVTYLPVQQNGLIDLEQLKAAIRPDTCIVSVMAVNNEIGVIQPLAEIGKICRERKVLFPHRRGAGVRQDPARRRCDEHRPAVDLRPQDLRAEGHRRALCPAQAARAARGADPWRRAGARHALRHAADAALRRPGRGLRHRAARDGRGGRAAEGPARPLPQEDQGAGCRRSISTAISTAASRATSTSPSPMSKARG